MLTVVRCKTAARTWAKRGFAGGLLFADCLLKGCFVFANEGRFRRIVVGSGCWFVDGGKGLKLSRKHRWKVIFVGFAFC